MGLESLFNFVHVSVIHLPLATFVIASGLIFVIISIKLLKISSFTKKESLLSKLELISWVNILIGWISFPIVALFGLLDASSIQNVVLTDLLAFKMQISFLTFFMFIPPLYLRFIVSKKTNHGLVEDNLLLFFYSIPILIGTFLTMIIAGAGGRYAFGHSLFDNFGLAFLIPDSFDYTVYRTYFNISFIAELAVSLLGVVAFIIIFLILITYPFAKKTHLIMSLQYKNEINNE